AATTAVPAPASSSGSPSTPPADDLDLQAQIDAATLAHVLSLKDSVDIDDDIAIHKLQEEVLEEEARGQRARAAGEALAEAERVRLAAEAAEAKREAAAAAATEARKQALRLKLTHLKRAAATQEAANADRRAKEVVRRAAVLALSSAARAPPAVKAAPLPSSSAPSSSSFSASTS
ncbi:unnamed protein product, partial [Pylaiella littoralis]